MYYNMCKCIIRIHIYLFITSPFVKNNFFIRIYLYAFIPKRAKHEFI